MKKREYAGRILLAAIAGVFLILAAFKRFSVNVVLSGSMEPALKTGGIIFTDTKKTMPGIGDIITYRMDDMLVTHRVTDKRDSAYITRGDANEGEDAAPVMQEQIVGTVVFFIPVLGYVAAFLKSKPVFGLISLMLIQELFYLTDYDKADNQFTVGKVEIELEEPGWKQEEHTKIEPGKEIEKDPQIQNTGVNDAFVYMEVTVPMADVMAADEEGNRLNKKMQELFTFTAKENWSLIDKKKKETAAVYVYAYDKILKPEQTTEPLFDMVKFLNIIEGQLDTQQISIPVRAYAIQSSYTGGDKDSIPEQAKEAYKKYVNQNKEQEGQVTT